MMYRIERYNGQPSRMAETWDEGGLTKVAEGWLGQELHQGASDYTVDWADERMATESTATLQTSGAMRRTPIKRCLFPPMSSLSVCRERSHEHETIRIRDRRQQRLFRPGRD
jgi:hypothetical protein